jgi:putative DNA methylase
LVHFGLTLNRNTFGRQAISIAWCFAELNPFSESAGNWKGAIEWICKVIKYIDKSELNTGQVGFHSATNLPLPDDSVAALITDPPYYGYVMYGDLSDFFYVILKGTVGDIYPNLFQSELVLKPEEIIATPTSKGPKGEDKSPLFYESKMRSALKQGRRIVASSGILVIVFAHKSTAGWEVMLSALVGAGWIVTASWPIDTERQGRTNAQGTAALGSSVHLVCRPRENSDDSNPISSVGNWRDIISELPKRIHDWMPRLAEEGIVGADAIFSCLGPALEIFSRYSSVERASGERVELKEYLEEVWAAVSREALNMIFEGVDASGFEEDARLTAMWLWTLRTATNGDEEEEADEGEKTKSLPGYSLEYDAARKIAQGLGVHLENLSHLVEIKGDTAILLSAGARSRYLFGKGSAEPSTRIKKKKSSQQKLFSFEEDIKQIEDESSDWVGEIGVRANLTLLDYLHQSMILFAAGRGEAMKRLLVEEGVGQNLQFWRLAQAFSALYLAGTDEKRWVDGVLARKKGLGF